MLAACEGRHARPEHARDKHHFLPRFLIGRPCSSNLFTPCPKTHAHTHECSFVSCGERQAETTCGRPVESKRTILGGLGRSCNLCSSLAHMVGAAAANGRLRHKPHDSQTRQGRDRLANVWRGLDVHSLCVEGSHVVFMRACRGLPCLTSDGSMA